MPGAKNDAHEYFANERRKKGAAQKKRGPECRTMPSARCKESGIFDKKVRQRDISRPVLRPGFHTD